MWFSRRFHSGTPDGRQLPFGSGDTKTRIRAITVRHSLFPSSQLRISNSVPYGCACPNCFERRYGISTFRVFDNEYLRSTLSTGGIVVRVEPCSRGPNHPRTFWSKPDSPFGLFRYNGSYRCSRMLTIVFSSDPSPEQGFQEGVRLTAYSPHPQGCFGALSGRLQTRRGFTPARMLP